MRTATGYPHIEVDETGMPHIGDTRFKVVQIVMDRLAYHWDADEIQRQHPHLTLGQVHSALAYYYDHEAEMDELIERRRREAQEILASLPESPVRAKLQAIKRQRGLP